MNRADLYKDLLRGRNRPGWEKEVLESLSEAAKDIGEISEEQISRTVRSYRQEKRTPELPLLPKVRKRGRRVVVDTSVLVTGISGFKEAYVPGRTPSERRLTQRVG